MFSHQQLEKLAVALGGVPVLGALPGSAAARAGLRFGDVLLSLNGFRTRNVGDFLRAREACSGRMELVIFRDGAERELVLELAPGEGEPRLLN